MATFTLITLNCFGVPAAGTARRLLALARELNRSHASLVCLQEVQTHAYRALLLKACKSYPFSYHRQFVHAPRGGLLTLSRTPFTRTEFILYQARGLWYTPAVADWLLHKGILFTQVLLDGLPIVVLNTHLTANYSGDWQPGNRYARNEWSQLQQLAEVVVAQPAGALVIVAGDLNIPRGSWLYDAFLAATGLHDPLAGDMRPTYRLRLGMPARYAQPIDFVLVRAPSLPGLRVWSDLCFQEKVVLSNGHRRYLSDHCGVELRLAWDHDASGAGSRG